MARSLRIPPLRFHKASKQYYVWRNGKRDYLGTDQAIAGERYKQFISEFVATPDPATTDPSTPTPPSAAGITIAEACLLYYRHKQAEAKDDALKFRRLSRIKQAVLAASDVCGAMPASQFKGKAFESIQRWLVRRPIKRKATLIEDRLGRPARFDPTAPISRQYANMLCRAMLRALSWLVKEEIFPAENLAIIREVPMIREQTGVRESPRITPVAPEAVDAVLPECHPILAAMIRLQQLTGMRPGEICAMRRCDVSTDPLDKITLPKSNYAVSAKKIGEQVVWVYVPPSHKTLWKRKARVVLIGPRAQQILAPMLRDRDSETHIFNPNEAVELFRAIQRANRKTPVQPSQRNRGKGCKVSRFDYYTNESYARAVARAIDRTNAKRRAAGNPEIPAWAPNQLRHAVATEVAERFDEATAAALIGHCGMDTIKVYAEQAIGKAAAAAAEMG